MFMRLTCFGFCLAAGLAPSIAMHTQDQMSPEMQKLVDQLKAQAKQGIPPTAEQMAQLQKLTQQYQTHFGTPGNAQIPCQVSVSMNYSATMPDNPSTTGWQETGSISGSAPAVMTANVNGNADYMKSATGPGASLFTITTTQATGFGTATVSQHLEYTVKGRENVHRSYSYNGNAQKAGAGLALMTTGSDQLYGRGTFNGPVTGNLQWSDSGRKPASGTNDWQSDNALPLFAAFTQEAEAQLKSGSPMPKPTANVSYSQLAKAIQSGASTSITCSEGFDITNNGIHYTGSSTVTIQLRPSKTHLVIEPDDESVYEKWMPVPDADDAGSASSAFPTSIPLTVHVALTDKSATPGSTAKTKAHSAVADVFDIDLKDVSNNPGVCMNYPKPGAGATNGLYFPKTQPPGITYIDEQHVKTSGSVVEATVTVYARDTGAYGSIEAKSENLKLTATDSRTGKQIMSIPMDDDNNHIADVWEKNNNVTGKDATWDECNTPSGMKKTGDGMSLYDKYRGVLTDDGTGIETFQRVSPSVRNLFIYIPQSQADKTSFEAGVAAYSRATGVKTTYIHDSTRMLPSGAPDQSGGSVTFNRTPYSEPVNAYAVIIFDDGGTESNGSTVGLDFADPYGRFSPMSTKAVLVRRQACQNQVQTFIGWATATPPIQSFINTAKTQGLDIKSVAQAALMNQGTLVEQLIGFVTLHELGHATGAAHHGLELLAGYQNHTIPLPPGKTMAELQTQYAQSGSTNCPMFYWQAGIKITFNPVLLFLASKWNPVMNSSTGAWAFCSDDWPEMSLKP